MSTTQYLNELETERQAIEDEGGKPMSDAARADWWDRLGEWWHRRDLGFGDGSGMKSTCFNKAQKIRDRLCVVTGECEFCGDPATRREYFNREVLVCDSCHAN